MEHRNSSSIIHRIAESSPERFRQPGNLARTLRYRICKPTFLDLAKFCMTKLHFSPRSMNLTLLYMTLMNLTLLYITVMSSTLFLLNLNTAKLAGRRNHRADPFSITCSHAVLLRQGKMSAPRCATHKSSHECSRRLGIFFQPQRVVSILIKPLCFSGINDGLCPEPRNTPAII